MKTTNVKKRLKKDRPMSSITIRMPEDVVDDLKSVAPTLGFSGYQPLIRFYIGQSLRKDLELLDHTKLDKFIAKLEERGVSQQIIKEVVSDL
jgi:hypothetical protein